MSVWRGVGNREVPHVLEKKGDARGKHGFPREREPEASVAHAAPPRVVRRTSAKNGAPKNAVTMRRGISAGASAVRAITSARTRNPAPATTEGGRCARYPVPAGLRIACGTQIPPE